MSPFQFHKLNTAGIDKAVGVQEIFDKAWGDLQKFMPKKDKEGGDIAGRERALVLTKLQEACFYAKKGVCQDERFLLKE